MQLPEIPLSEQMKKRSEKPVSAAESQVYDGAFETVISTGSTLLDLAISGGRVRGGGIPGGILVEIFGPSSTGKTVLLCEIAGSVQRQGGKVMFRDPEARLNKQFSRLFGLDPDEMDYGAPDTVVELFSPIRKWNPKPAGKKIHGVFADSLAALSTEWEIEEKDQYGMRRAKEFSEQCRLTCRILAEKNFLMVCSNQIRQNMNAGPYGQKYRAPGGEALPFYASLRLRLSSPQKLRLKKSVAGEKITKTIGIKTEVEVFKSSVWEPFGIAPVWILFDYGVDDIRANLFYLKHYRGTQQYVLGEEKLGRTMEEAIKAVEEGGREEDLRQETIDFWHEIQKEFKSDRKPRKR